MSFVKGQFLLGLALTASSLAWAADPSVPQSNFKNIDPGAPLTQSVGNFGGTGTTSAQAPMPVGGSGAGQGQVLHGSRPLFTPGDLPQPAPGSKVAGGSVLDAVARMGKKTLPASTLPAAQAFSTTACEFIQYAMDRTEPSKADQLAVATVMLNRGEAPAQGLKNVIVFTSKSEEPQSFAYSTVTRKFYRLDRDFNPETNTEVTLLGEMATQSRDGGVKSEIYNAENNALVNIQGLNELIDQSLKALATADESKSTAATSAQVGCADYPNWRVQRFGDANKKAKAKSPSSSSLSNWFPNIWLNGK